MITAIISIFWDIAGTFGWGIYDFLGGVYANQIGAFKSLLWSQLARISNLIGLIETESGGGLGRIESLFVL